MATSRYDQETQDRCVRMYFTALEEGASSKAAALRDVAGKTGIKETTLRNWARKAENTQKEANQVSESDKDAELKQLRNEVRQLREANEILKLASAFFAQAELDRKLK
ncbi:transposase [Corynebacterium cystitidis]|uniref:transposase n=1 Tax=Corynebacterium cystitidis TaxID=35757 RepID=UPI00211F0A4C|nr:transposase [Corynebacterium cystitidis]